MNLMKNEVIIAIVELVLQLGWERRIEGNIREPWKTEMEVREAKNRGRESH